MLSPSLFIQGQALTGTRYPTLPGFYFYYPYPTRKFFQNFRVQGSNYTCCFQSRIISMMPANRLRRKRNLLKIVKIDRNAEHLQFIMEMALILLKRRGGKLSFYVFYIKVTWSSAGSVRFSWVIFSWLRLSAQIGPEPTSDKNSQTGHRMIF